MDNISATTDTLFAPLTVATAREASRPMLEKVQKSLGFIPNLMATDIGDRWEEDSDPLHNWKYLR